MLGPSGCSIARLLSVLSQLDVGFAAIPDGGMTVVMLMNRGLVMACLTWPRTFTRKNPPVLLGCPACGDLMELEDPNQLLTIYTRHRRRHCAHRRPHP